jgi:L-fuconolactonase
MASYENVSVKVSGLFTEAKWDSWTNQSFKPYLDHILNTFTPSRMMFGSDWPVCLLAATYSQTVDLMEEFTMEFSNTEKESFWFGAVKRSYRLKV